jgi:YVTN family beta-propeller protein
MKKRERMTRLSQFALSAALVLAIGVGQVGCDDQEPGRSEPDVSDTRPVDDIVNDPIGAPDTDTSPDSQDEPDLDARDDEPLPVCIPDPPPEAFRVAGPNDELGGLSPGGRDLTPAGANLRIEGFPSDVALHPGGRYALVTSTSSDDRRLVVVDLETADLVQDIDRGEASFGLAVSSSGEWVYASGGANLDVDVYSMAPDGTLSQAGSIEVGSYPSGLALSPDGTTLWVALFNGSNVLEVDTATSTVRREIPVGGSAWDLLHLPSRGELYVSTLAGQHVSVVDLDTGQVDATIEVGRSPTGMAVSPDEDRVWVAVSGIDQVVTIDTNTRQVVDAVWVAEPEPSGGDGAPLPNSNVNAVAYDAADDRLYVSRGADNAVSVLAAGTMEVIGSLPTAWYPTGVAVSSTRSTLVVIEGKGFGSGPSLGRSSKNALTGSITLVDLTDLDLVATSEAVISHYNRPTEVFPFECEGDFPIPTRPGQESPIDTVILIVKENKTFDCVFGDLTEMDVDADPDLVRFGEEITPNQHALARQFAFSDNFYTEVENSDMGHLLLTATHLTEYVERVWAEVVRTGWFQGFQVADSATPEAGNVFTQLLDHGVDIGVYGEIVGMFAEASDGTLPFAFSDQYYPGGRAFNLSVSDESRARYLAERIASGELATFSFVSLPNDHTLGTRPGVPTPESMVADNDYAVGLIIEALSESPYWESSAVFIVEDDPQGCFDHVDAHRSFVFVVSPWARRGYVSHVNYSFVSVFATIERILGVPPLGRPDGSASPMWDMFATEPDFSPYEALERRVPEEINSARTTGARASLAMDFRSPDRNPDLVVVLDAYRLYRMGRISREEADRRVATHLPDDRLEALREEAREEAIAFESAWRQYEAWLRARDLPVPELHLGPVAE